MMGPASFWQWAALDKCGINKNFRPVLTFSKSLPIPSANFSPRTTGQIIKTSKSVLVFPNGLETYYMVNAAEDTLYGWSQDTAFTYQSLRRLTDKVGNNGHFKDDGIVDAKGYVYTLNANKRPRPSSRNNGISLPITKQPAGTIYVVRWFDAETGYEMKADRTLAVVGKDNTLSFDFPVSIREKRRINNTFGDAVFFITVDTSDTKNGGIMNNAANGDKKIRIKKGFLRQ